jgi:large conductance mechanosensitive channel
MAVGIVVGAAFGKIVSSLVGDLIMPIVAKLTGNIDFSSKFIVLGEGHFATLAEAKTAGAATLNYGVFINSVVDFVIVAFAIFMMIKAINNLKRKHEEQAAAPAAPPADVALLTEIRDLLKRK